MKVKRKIIHIDDELCDGCGVCIPSCAEGALEIVDGKARMVSEKFCDGLGACLGECPNGALTVVEREAEDFDEEAVEAYLREKENDANAEPERMTGCPSSQIQTRIPSAEKASSGERAAEDSQLTHWPVQIRLVPPTAPFLKGADILVAADCVPVACPNFHRDYLKGKVVLVGCPKFDEVNEYVRKFVDIFNQADIRSITALIMEVPCCSGLPWIVKKALKVSGKTIPMEEVVIGTGGEELRRQGQVA